MNQDRWLEQAVLAELAWEPGVAQAGLVVVAEHGVVTLTGHVASHPQRLAAEEAARRVRGVRAVAVDVEVRLAPGAWRSDAAIASALLERLSWNASLVAGSIQVGVSRGRVTLTGEVDRHLQQEAAQQDAGCLHGVVGVSDRTTIRARADVSTLREDIVGALHRSWLFDPAMVEVAEEDGRVRLTGRVHSPSDRLLAARTAWAAAGTRAVENNIVVG